MINTKSLIDELEGNKLNEKFSDIYYDDENMIGYQKERYIKAVGEYEKIFGEGDVELYSAPGRTEVGGNHTDHQHGSVLAASINLDAIAIVAPTTDSKINIYSDGYGMISVDLDSLKSDAENSQCNAILMEELADSVESGTTASLILGVAAGMLSHGYNIGSFNAYITSDVLNGAGLSSSAAFEALIGTIFSGMYNDMSIPAVDIAIIGQYAENVFFGKPCGLMDQMACSVGGFVHIDFKDVKNPIVEKVSFDIESRGYSLCIVDTKGSHADLTPDYAAIPAEMKEIANKFGKDFLVEVNENDFYKKLSDIKGNVSDRSILRAIHFFNENKRVGFEVNSLKDGRFDDFLSIVKESGDSSYKFLQNVYSNSNVHSQAVSVALALSEHFLGTNGISRVHGGGFAGTIQAYVKNEFVDSYKDFIEDIIGKGTCHILKIRKYGGIKVL